MPPDVTRYFITLVIALAAPCVRHEGGGVLKVSPSSRSSLSLRELTASSPTRIVLIDAGLRALPAHPWLRALILDVLGLGMVRCLLAAAPSL